MKKTISISLGGYVFMVEEDAYEQLSAYLEAVRRQFSSYPDSGEIMQDMEARIAEHFQMAGKGTDKVVTSLEVNDLIKTMGQPKDFAGEETPGTNSSAPLPPRQKKLMRDSDDKIIAGVCSGLAAYFGFDSVWVRLGFAVFVLLGGSGVLLYIVLWLIMPEAKTETEKMQMRGEPVTLKQIEQNIKERVAEVDTKNVGGKAKNFLERLFAGIGKVIKIFFRIIFKLIGLAIVVGAVAALIGVTFALVAILFNQNSPYVDFPIRDFLQGVPYFVALFTAFFAAFIPLLFLLFAGSSLLGGRPTVSRYTVLGLLVFWAASLITGGALATRYAPEIEAKMETHPLYAQKTKSFSEKDFNSLRLYGGHHFTVTKGKDYSITATGREKDLESLDISVTDGKLTVSDRERNRICIFCMTRDIQFAVTMPDLREINASGATRVEAKGFATTTFTTKLSGASQATLTIQASTTTFSLSGASRVEIAGVAATSTIESSGASRFMGEDFVTQNMHVKLSGASTAYVQAQKELQLEASGASRAYVYGDPTIRHKLSGSSRLIRENGTNYEDSDEFELEMPIEPAMP